MMYMKTGRLFDLISILVCTSGSLGYATYATRISCCQFYRIRQVR